MLELFQSFPHCQGPLSTKNFDLNVLFPGLREFAPSNANLSGSIPFLGLFILKFRISKMFFGP